MATTTAEPVLNPNFVSHSGGLRPNMLEPTPQQRRQWHDTRTALLWACPAFSYLLFKMMNPLETQDIAYFTDDPQVPVAATDGETLFLNPETFFKYRLQERVFILGHEIMHNVLNHPAILHTWAQAGVIKYPNGKTLPFRHDVANRAADYIINDLLIKSRVGLYNTDWLHDTDIATSMDGLADAYAKVYEDEVGGGGNGKGPQGPGQPQPGNSASQPNKKGQKGFDGHLKPGTGQGKDPTAAKQSRKQQDWKTAFAAAKTQGKMPADLERVFDELLKPEIDWTDLIRGFFAKKVGSGSYDWRRPDRRWISRDIYIPGRAGHGAGTVVIVDDTSGSIGDKPEQEVFMGAMREILEDLRPRRVIVIFCDARIHSVEDVTDVSDLSKLRPKGGGGTDFRPPFKWVKDNGIEPDALVYLTDLYGPAPAEEPGYPVLWARTTKAAAPWGDVVDLPMGKNAR